MKNAIKRVSRWKKVISWILTIAILAGNLSQIALTTSYASEGSGGRASRPAAEAKIEITQGQIQKVLKKDMENRPEFDEDAIPFQGNKKQALADKLYELMEGKTLIKQGKVSNGMYLVLIDGDVDFDEEVYSHIYVIAVNAYEDRDYHFLVQMNGTSMVIEAATESWYQIVDDGTEEPEPEVEADTDSASEEEEALSLSLHEVSVAGAPEGEEALDEGDSKEDEKSESEESSREDGELESEENSKEDGELENGEASKAEEASEAQEASKEQQEFQSNETKNKNEVVKTESESEYEVYPIFEEDELSDADLLRLMGQKATKDEQKGVRTSLLRLATGSTAKASDDYYTLNVKKSGISMLTAQVSQEEDIFSRAEELWGDEENHRRIANVKINSDHTGDTKAGEPFYLTLSYSMAPRPIYSFSAGSVNYYQELEDTSVSLTVPAQMVIEEGGEALDNGDGTHTYTIPTGNIKSNGTRQLTAYFAGNGEVALGTEYSMDAESAVSFTGTITIRDPLGDTDQRVSYTLTDIGSETEEDEEENTQKDLSWRMISQDEWTVTKKLKNEGKRGIPEELKINGETRKAVKFQYELAVGLKKNGEIQSQDKYYFDAGRAEFESFLLTDQVVMESGAEPLMMTLTSKEGETKTVYGTSTISTEFYHTRGFHGTATEFHETADSAPSYTVYEVTVYYPYEDFELNYWDSRVDDPTTFAVQNTAELQYQLKGDSFAQTVKSQMAEGYYQYANGYERITIKTNLTIPLFGKSEFDRIPYSAEQGEYYPGYASFSVEKKNQDGNYEPYPLERIMVKGNEGFEPIGQLAVNPWQDEYDEGVSVQGENGSISFYVDAGEYRITEVHQPLNTKNESSEPEYVDVRSHEAQVIFNNRVVNKGGIQFIKKGQVYDETGLTNKQTPLEGAEFGLYKTAQDTQPIMKAVSDQNGVVKFYPLNKGSYVIRELSAPEGFVADEKTVYEVLVPENNIAGLTGISSNTLVNKANKGVVKVSQYIKDFTTGGYERLSVSNQDLKKSFTIEKKAGGVWLPVEGLAQSGIESGSFTWVLPVYESGQGKNGSAITYRVKEILPSAYTAVSIEGEQKVEESGSLRYVITEPFQLDQAFENQIVKEISVKNIPRGSLQLFQNAAEYKAQEKGQSLSYIPESGKEIYLFKKTGGSYELVASKSTDAQGSIRLDNLDVEDEKGQPIEYYWYEKTDEGKKLFAYEKPYSSGSKQEVRLTRGDITLKGTQIKNAELIGPFRIGADIEEPSAAYVYDVVQRVPFWAVIKDAVSKKEVLWKAADSKDWRFTLTISSMEGNEEAHAYNDGNPVYLETGKKYKIKETLIPGNYSEYKGEDGLDYQIIDLTGYGEIGLEAKSIPDRQSGLTVEFTNHPKRLMQIEGLLKPGFNSVGVKTDQLQFGIYVLKEEGGKKQFVSATQTAFSSGKSYYVEPGSYYFKQIKVLDGYIDPAFYLGDKGISSGGLGYQRDGHEIYYGPVEVSETENGLVTASIENIKNAGTIKAYKYDTSTGLRIPGARIQVYREKDSTLSTKEERTASGNLIYLKGVNIYQVDNGTAVFENLPVYDASGKKISYVLGERTAPNGYDLDYSRYEAILEPGKIRDTVREAGEDEKELAFWDNPLETIVVYKYWHSLWGNHFSDIKNELSGVTLALYEQNPGEDGLTFVQTSVTGEDGGAVFKGKDGKGLDRSKNYYVFEAYAHEEYLLPDGKQPLAAAGVSLPETIPAAEVSSYNGVFFEALSADSREIERKGEIFNNKSWVQFQIVQFAQWELSTTQDEQYTVPMTFNGVNYFAKHLGEKKKVNGAKYELYEQDITGAVLDSKNPGTLVQTYETGTRLNGSGSACPGEVMTTILKPGKIYWLKEINTGYGYIKGDIKMIAMVPNDGTTYTAGEDVRIIPYEDNSISTVEVEKYKLSQKMSGESRLAQVKLNQWLDEGDGTYKPLGGVGYELRIAGKTYSSMETGLENDFREDVEKPTAQAISGYLNYERILKDLKERLAASDITQAQYDEVVNEEAHTLVFDLIEVKAPERVELAEEAYPITVEFNSTKWVTINTQYYYNEKNETGIRLVNKALKGYSVTVRAWGYQPTDEMLADGAPLLTDQLLDEMTDLSKEPLSGVKLTLYKKNAVSGAYEKYLYDGKNSSFTTKNGIWVFQDGLPSGQYCLSEDNMGALNQNRYYRMYSSKWYGREFTVLQTQNVVNLYNPELPSLKLTKETLLNESVSFEGFSLALTGAKSYSQAIKSGENAVSFAHIEPGTYMISETGENSDVSSSYLSVLNNTSVTVGFTREISGGQLYLKKLAGSLSLNGENGYTSELSLKNSRKASLSIKKVDKETNAPLEQAQFQYQWAPFEAGDFQMTAEGIRFSYADGLVTDPLLMNTLEAKDWSKPSAPAATGADGRVLFEHLEPGWYRIQEYQAPESYELSGEVRFVAVTADMTGSYVEITDGGEFCNQRHVETLSITKNLDLGSLSGQMSEADSGDFRFELYLGKTDENGLFSGTRVMEKEASLTKADFNASNHSAVTEIRDIRQLTSNEISEGSSYYLKETADASWLLKEAYEGESRLEITADGYIRLPGFETSQPVAVRVTSQYLKADVAILKTDKAHPEKRLSGAEFKLYDSSEVENGEPKGRLLAVSEEKENGVYEFNNIPLTGPLGNTYYLFETKAPTFYVRQTEPVLVTLLPGQRCSWETEPSLVIFNESGVDVSLIKYNNTRELAGENDIQDSDVVFNLYSSTTPEDPDAVWTLEQEGCTPEASKTGRIEWKGLSLSEGKTYAVYEQPVTSGKYENTTLDSVWGEQEAAGRITARTSDGGEELRTLFVLQGLEPGKNQVFKAYAKPAIRVVIRKTDWSYGDGNLAIPGAVFEIRKEDGTLVKSGVKTTWSIGNGRNYSEAEVMLKEGVYRLTEIEADQGYSLIPDDERVIHEATIRVPDEKTNNIYTFVNMKVNNELSFKEELVNPEQKLESLWWNDNQTLSYKLTPTVENESALTGFTVRDEGLTMTDSKGKELIQSQSYSFTKVRIPAPKEEIHIMNTTGQKINAEDMGAISAKVTFEYFGGETEEVVSVIKDHLDGEGFWTVTPKKTGKVKAFWVEYFNERVQEKTGGKYVLGQCFDPGTIEVEAVVSRQEIGNQNDWPEPVAAVHNDTAAVMDYLSYDEKGISKAVRLEKKSSAETAVLEPDIPTVEIGLSVVNKTNPQAEGLQVQIDDKLQYTMSLKNVSKDEIKAPMLNPLFFNKLPKGVVPDFNTVNITVNGSDLSWNADEIMTQADQDGFTYLYVPFKGKLWQENTITIAFEAQVKEAVINNGAEVRDEMFVTSTLQNSAFTNNYGGATFKVWNEKQGMDSWPGVQNEPGLERLAKALGLPKNNGYASTYIKNVFGATSEVTLLKEGRGNVDELAGTGFVSGLNSARVTPEGGITYRLITKNTSTRTVVTQLRVLDMLPALKEKENYDGASRGSEWRVELVYGTIRLSKLSSDGETKTDVTGFSVYYLPEGEALRKTVLSNFADPQKAGWLTSIPSGKQVSAVLIDTMGQMSLDPGESLIVEYEGKVPEISTERELEELAYKYAVNDFSVQYKYKEDPRLSMEKLNSWTMTSNLVQAVLIPKRVGVGGKIWLDANGNGIQDDQGFGAEKDLRKLLANDYFHVALRSWGEESGTTIAQNGTISENPLEQTSVVSEGILNSEGQFLFSGILPAQPHSENKLYTAVGDDASHNTIRNVLNARSLKGANPEYHKLLITTEGEKSAEIIPGMLLESAPVSMMESGVNYVSNKEGGKSRRPEELNSYPNEAKDSNFIGSKTGYSSESFFLWPDHTEWDRTKDLGLIPYRKAAITVTGEAGERLSGSEFTIYGPFAPGEKAAADGERIVYQGSTDENGVLSGMPKLLYYMNYLVEENKAAPNYTLEGAEASLDPCEGMKAGWLLKSGITKAEIKNQYERGALTFSKVDGKTKENLKGAVFCISRSADQKGFANVSGSMKTFLEESKGWSAEELEAMGIAQVSAEKEALYFTTTGKQVRINGLPVGRYVLKETKAPEYYNSLTDQNTYEFTVSPNQEAKLKGLNENVISNVLAEADIVLEKRDIYGNLLKNVELTIEGPGVCDEVLGFRRFKPEDSEGLKTIRTDENGQIALSVPLGDYRITEKTPEGYVQTMPFYLRVSKDSNTPLSLAPGQGERPDISFKAGQSFFTVWSTPAAGSLEMENVDSTDKNRRLTGGEFVLTGQSLVSKAWSSYLKDSSKIQARGIELIDADAKAGTLSFRIIGTKGGQRAGSNAIGYLEGIPYGTYHLTQIKAPAGYILTQSPWSSSFTIQKENSKICYITSWLLQKTEGAVANDPSKLTVVKTNAVYADTRLAGAEFLIKANDGTYVKLKKGMFDGFTAKDGEAGRIVTGKDGQSVIYRLPEGTYTLIETKAPEGYQINKKIPAVTFDGINSFTITIQDEKLKKPEPESSASQEEKPESSKAQEEEPTNSGKGDSGSSSGGGSHSKPSSKESSGHTRSPQESGSHKPGTAPEDTVTILPDEIPLAGLLSDKENDVFVDLDDGEVPLARLPKTGERKSPGKLMVAVSGFMLALYAALSKKKKSN